LRACRAMISSCLTSIWISTAATGPDQNKLS
jgi:hypothetical protein